MKHWSDIGAHLRAKRNGAGLTLQDVSHRTRIPIQTLRQLEENDYSGFPGAAYTKGFLGQYCEYLEVDAADYLDRLETGDVFANLEHLGYLKDSSEVLGEVIPKDQRKPLPDRPRKQPPRAARKPVTANPPAPAPSSENLQPLVVFTLTAIMISAGIYAFVRISDSIEEAAFNSAQKELAENPTLSPTPSIIPSRPASPKRSKTLNARTPAVAEVVPEGSNDAPPPTLVIDSPPPRAVIIEE